MTDVYLFDVPSDTNSADGRLRSTTFGLAMFAAVVYAGQPILINARTTIPVTAAAIAYTPKTVNTVANTIKLVTVAAVNYAGQAITANARKNVAVTVGGEAYTGQPITINARKVVSVAIGAVGYAGQPVVVNAKTNIFVLAGGAAYSGVPIKLNRTVVVIGGLTQYVPQLIATNSQTIVQAASAAVSYTTPAVSVKRNLTVSFSAAGLQYIPRGMTVSNFSASTRYRLAGVAENLSLKTGINYTYNRNLNGYWWVMSKILEDVTGVPLNLTGPGNALSAGTSFDSIAGSDGSVLNKNQPGYERRLAEAMEAQTGTVTAGDYIERIRVASEHVIL